MNKPYITEISEALFAKVAAELKSHVYKNGEMRSYSLMRTYEHMLNYQAGPGMIAIALHNRPTFAQKDVQTVDPKLDEKEASFKKWVLAMLEFGTYSDAQNERDTRRSCVAVANVVACNSGGKYWVLRLNDGTSRMIPKEETENLFVIHTGTRLVETQKRKEEAKNKVEESAV